jgi:hypothetical protein
LELICRRSKLHINIKINDTSIFKVGQHITRHFKNCIWRSIRPKIGYLKKFYISFKRIMVYCNVNIIIKGFAQIRRTHKFFSVFFSVLFFKFLCPLPLIICWDVALKWPRPLSERHFSDDDP